MHWRAKFLKERAYTTVQKENNKIQRIHSNVLLIIMIDVKVRSMGVTSSILEQTSLGARLLMNVNEWWIECI